MTDYYGGKWLGSSIRAILANKANIGHLVWRMKDYSSGCKIKPESEWVRFGNAHPAIVSHAVFELSNEKRS